jgi:hypothetical protein
MVSMLRDGIERRFRRDGFDYVVEFVELHELEDRPLPQNRDLPDLVQLLPDGRTLDVDVVGLWTKADAATSRDLSAVRRLQSGEATELYYLDRFGHGTGRKILARLF